MGIFDWKHWIVLLAVVVLVFGTKKLKHLGADLGESVKGFRKAMSDEETKPAAPHAHPVPPAPSASTQPQGHILEGQALPATAPQRNH